MSILSQLEVLDGLSWWFDSEVASIRATSLVLAMKLKGKQTYVVCMLWWRRVLWWMRVVIRLGGVHEVNVSILIIGSQEEAMSIARSLINNHKKNRSR